MIATLITRHRHVKTFELMEKMLHAATMIGWSKSGKETYCKYCKSCFKPATQRIIKQNMPETEAKGKRNTTIAFLQYAEKLSCVTEKVHS